MLKDRKGGGKVSKKEVSANQNRIKQLRLEQRKTQKEVGKAVGLSDRAIAHYEKGIREPKLDIWIKLADYFGVSVSYLQGVTENSSPKSVQGEFYENLLTDTSESEKMFSKIAKTRSLSAQKMAKIVENNEELFNWVRNISKEDNKKSDSSYMKELNKLPLEYQRIISAILLLVAYSNSHSGKYREELNIILSTIRKLNNPKNNDSIDDKEN